MKYKKLIGSLLIGVLLIIVSAVSLSAFGFSRGDHHKRNYDMPDGIEFEDLDIADGVYAGEAEGFRPGLVVEVRVEDSEVIEVSVIEHNEIGRQYYQTPINLIPADIVDQQKTDVDIVSGASATSYAIMSAVENALTD